MARRFSSRRTRGYKVLDRRGRIPALQNPMIRLRVYAYIFVCMYVCRKSRHICVKVSMHAHICMYVMYTRIYVCMYVCMYVRKYVRMYVCMFVLTFICIGKYADM